MDRLYFFKLRQATAMPDGQSVTAARAGRELLRERVAGGGGSIRHPSHGSYLRYAGGTAYVRSHRVDPPGPTTTAPDAPTAVTAVAGNARATISFMEPANTGGDSITSYTVTSSPGGFTAAGSSSPLTVTGLANGTAYTFTVTAANGVGPSQASAVSNSVTPFGVPSEPTIVSATRGNQQATIAFNTPTDTGGASITNYKYSINNGVTWVARTPANILSPLVITGLTNGTTYQIKLLAVNAAGDSAASTASSVTPATSPAAPTGLSAIPASGQVTVSFTPGLDGGSPIINYEYSTDNGVSFTAFTTDTGAVSSVVITGLTDGNTYNIKLKAVTVIGISPASATVTANLSGPGTPTLQYILADDSAAYLYFTAGAGGTVANYEYSLNGGSITALAPASTSSPFKILSLANGTTYSIVIYAINNFGRSGASNPLSVTPVAPSVRSPWLYYDPSVPASYSRSGNTVNNLGDYGALTGTKAAGVSYNADVKGGVFDFPGTDGNVISFPSLDFGNTISVTAWVYPRLKNDINGLLANAGANVPTNGFKFQWNWWLNSSRVISFQAGNGSNGNDDSTITNIVEYNTWQHFGYIFDRTNQKVIFSLNGVPAAVTTDVTTVANINTIAPFNIGGYIGNFYTMNAQLGYIKVFNTLLDATQIKADYDNTKARFL